MSFSRHAYPQVEASGTRKLAVAGDLGREPRNARSRIIGVSSSGIGAAEGLGYLASCGGLRGAGCWPRGWRGRGPTGKSCWHAGVVKYGACATISLLTLRNVDYRRCELTGGAAANASVSVLNAVLPALTGSSCNGGSELNSTGRGQGCRTRFSRDCRTDRSR